MRSLPGKGFLVPAVEHRIFDVELVGQVAGEMGGQMRTGALSGEKEGLKGMMTGLTQRASILADGFCLEAFPGLR